MKWFKKNEEVDYFDKEMSIKEETASYEVEVVEAPPLIENIHDPNFFGKIQHLIDDINITDINCNSRSIWINHISKGRYECTDVQLSNEDIEFLMKETKSSREFVIEVLDNLK